MPLTGTENLLAAARLAAKEEVYQRWRMLDRVLTPAEMGQMRLEAEVADSKAILTHITVNATVIVASVSGVTTGPGVSGPGAGTIT
jgi:hypothetical protein